MLPRLTRLVNEYCVAPRFASSCSLVTVRFVTAHADGSLVTPLTETTVTPPGPLSCALSVSISALDAGAVDEFVQLTDLVAQGVGAPPSSTVEALVKRISAGAFWGSQISQATHKNLFTQYGHSTAVLDAVMLRDGGGVLAGWFHHGYGSSLNSLYLATLAGLSRGRQAHLRLLAAEAHQAASKAFSEGNPLRYMTWQPASATPCSALTLVQRSQLSALLRALRERSQTDSVAIAVEDAWMLLRLRRHVWWWRTPVQRSEGCHRLGDALIHSGASISHATAWVSQATGPTLASRSDKPQFVSVEGRLAAGFLQLTGAPYSCDARSFFLPTMAAHVTRHLQTLRCDDECLFRASTPTHNSRPPSEETHGCTPASLAERHVQRHLCASLSVLRHPDAPRAHFPQSHERAEFTGFSVGADAESHLSSLLCVADFLCATTCVGNHAEQVSSRERSPSSQDTGAVMRAWRHALRTAALRRYGGATASTWSSRSLCMRAFPFLEAVQRSFDAEAAQSVQLPWRLLFLALHATPADTTEVPLPPQWPAFVEALQPLMHPCFGYCSLADISSDADDVRTVIQCQVLCAGGGVTTMSVAFCRTRMSELRTLSTVQGRVPNWVCAVALGTTCRGVYHVDASVLPHIQTMMLEK